MKLIKFADQSIDAVEKDVSEITISGAPAQNVWNYFLGNNNTFKSGMWDAKAGVFKVSMNAQIEYCHILEGEARIESSDGKSWTVSAGDSFVMDNGLETTWHVENYIRKHYVICAV